jgi:hypothetical protein
MIEVGFLLDLFRRKSDQIARWRNLATKADRDAFKMVNVRKTLDDLDGNKDANREAAYKFFSQHGTHADANAVQIISPDMMTIIGPFPDETRVRGITFDLARYLAIATVFVTRCIDHQRIGDVEQRLEYAKALIAFARAVQQWREGNRMPG